MVSQEMLRHVPQAEIQSRPAVSSTVATGRKWISRTWNATSDWESYPPFHLILTNFNLKANTQFS